jgi:EF hand
MMALHRSKDQNTGFEIMKNVTRNLTLALTLAAAGAVFADDAASPAATNAAQGTSPVADLNSLDTNKDGRLSPSEVQSNADLRSSFTSLDINGDGYLSSTEFGKYGQGAKPKAMAPAHSAADSPSTSTGPATSSTPKY